MSCRELWESIKRSQSNENGIVITAKQRQYLIDLARIEKIFDAGSTLISFTDGLRVSIRPIFKKVEGKPLVTEYFRCEEMYMIEFLETKVRTFCSIETLDKFRNEFNSGFKIVKS